MSIASQLTFRPDLPVVLNNVDYQRREAELKRMDEILRGSGAEEAFVEATIKVWMSEGKARKESGAEILKEKARLQRGLRCSLLRSRLKLSYREMSTRLAECPLYQWFCHLDRLGEIQVLSKSEIHRGEQLATPEVLKEINAQVISAAAQVPEAGTEQVLGLKNEIELKTVWMDSTAVKTNIHYPVDWVLVRDATRTLMKATLLIRKHGLKHRMECPKKFLGRMNGHCMGMSATRRKAGGRRKRKQVFRTMKRLMKTVSAHAERHRELLQEHWRETDWSEAQAAQVIARIEGVLELLPEAMKQAHARIIRGELTPSSQKILSLYEREVNVIVRGKPESETEFGNSLLLVEQEDGLIVDWKLHEKAAPDDSHQMRQSIERLEAAHGSGVIGEVVGDRQFDSKSNRKWLEKQKISNSLCPRSLQELKEKLQEPPFKKAQHRRAQTEARIAILKNVFLGNPAKGKGFKNRERQVGWSVLAHNLWLLSRMERAKEKPEALALAA